MKMQTRREAYLKQNKRDFSGGAELHPIPIICEDDSKIPRLIYLKEHYISRYDYRRSKFNGCDCKDEDDCRLTGCACFAQRTDFSFVECNSGCACNSNKCKNRRSTKFVNPKLEIRYSESGCHGGFGVFATAYIKRTRMIGIYTGAVNMFILSSLKELNKRCGELLYSFEMKDKLSDAFVIIDAEQCGNYTRFINHSCEPNVYQKNGYIGKDFRVPTPVFYTKRDIQAGEQLTIDYGVTYFDEKRPCKCGSKRCRFGIV